MTVYNVLDRAVGTYIISYRQTKIYMKIRYLRNNEL